MLIRCVNVYSTSCLQIALVYLQPFCCNSLSKCVAQTKIAKKTMKPHMFGVQGLSKSSMLIRIKSSSLGSISMPIWNRFHGRLDNNGKITTFMRYCSLMLSCTRFLELRESGLRPLKFTLNVENLILSFSMFVSIDFGAIRSWNVSPSPKSPQIYKKNSYFSVQGYPRSLNLMAIESKVYDFLLVINSNLGLISHHYWDTATYWLKSQIFPFSAFVRGEPLWIYRKAFGSWN